MLSRKVLYRETFAETVNIFLLDTLRRMKDSAHFGSLATFHHYLFFTSVLRAYFLAKLQRLSSLMVGFMLQISYLFVEKNVQYHEDQL